MEESGKTSAVTNYPISLNVKVLQDFWDWQGGTINLFPGVVDDVDVDVVVDDVVVVVMMMTSYHPQTTLTEWLNHTLKTIGEQHEDWDKWLKLQVGLQPNWQSGSGQRPVT